MVIHTGYETVAAEFGLTEENCPNRGRASLPMEKLAADFEAGTLMFGYFLDHRLVGFLGMAMQDGALCKLNDVVVLPECRGKGVGQTLLDFCKAEAVRLGAAKIRLGMINDNTRLKTWYVTNGFATVETRQYDGAPFLAGYMQYDL
jgi:ribosomal protein S18 acetylase RimI-like enzyme